MSATTEEIHAATALHRRLAADLFDDLTEEELATQSLCAAWDVRHVAAHLVMPLTVPLWRFAITIARARGNFDRASVMECDRIARRPVADLTGLLRAKADERFAAPGVGPGGQLADTAVHLRDAARPLGRADTIPPASWAMVLDYLVTKPAQLGHVPRGLPEGLSFRATDQEWSHGTGGAEVSGPSEALALALCARPVALADLDGPGLPTLQEQVLRRTGGGAE